jgi:hypothetical protein
MTAITQAEFLQKAIDAATSSYPTIAQYIKAGDPRVMAMLGAMSTMLAMRSEENEVALYEPFAKARDATVLADASLKGILPLARACRVSLSVTNGGTSAYTLASGRRVQDPKGRIYQVDADATIQAGTAATVTATQVVTRTISHTVTQPSGFYAIEVAQTADDVFLNSLSVWKGSQEFTYSPDWFNVMSGDYAYQAETDERRRLWVRFGSTGVVGYGVAAGDVIELRVTECEGRIAGLAPDDVFTLEYSYSAAEGLLSAKLSGVLDEGANPPGMADLRVMSRYPAIYDHNAVYLGEFDLMLRRYLSPIRFLSVWNEQAEEAARGASVNNINKLFVSGLVTGMSAAAFQAKATQLIQRADNSYRIQFVNAALTPVAVVVAGKVAMVHDAAAVAAQVRAAILAQFGDGQPAVSQGGTLAVRTQAISRLLRDKVPALADELSDFTVNVTAPTTMLPEMFMYVSDASLTVTIDRLAYGNGLWSR